MAGITKIMRIKFTGMIIAAKIPNARIGTISDSPFARKATDVVLDVTMMALKARLKAYAILSLSSLAMLG